MGNEQNNPSESLTGVFPIRQMFLLKSWVERAYHQHVIRYSDWNERDYRLIVRMAVTIIFIVVVTASACAIRIKYLRMEEQSEVKDAQRFLAQGDYAKAATAAGRALVLNPTDLAACRAMADAKSLGKSSAELFWVQRLADIEPTTENKLRLAETGLRCQTAPFPVTSVVLTDLAQNEANNPTFQMLAGNLAAKMHQPVDAEAHFKVAVQLDPSNQQYALSLAIIQLGLPDPAVKKQARQHLEKLALDTNVGVDALRALVTDCQSAGDYVSADHYSDQLLASPHATMMDRLQNLEVLKQFNQNAFSERLRSVMNLAANQAPMVAPLSTWMQENGLAAENLEWLPSLPWTIRSGTSYKVALANAYLQMGRWQDMLDFANRDNWSDQDFLRLAMLSRAWAQLGVPTVAQSNWGDAVKKAGDHYEAMTNLLVLAQRWQLTDAQQDLRERILQLAPQ